MVQTKPTYLITGYRPINSTLLEYRRRRLANLSTCPMYRESEKTTKHIISDCVAYEANRFIGIESYKNSRKNLIANEEMLARFNKLTRKIFCLRRENGRNESRGSASTWQGLATKFGWLRDL